MAAGLIIVPLISYLEAISIAKGFAKIRGYQLDPNQEFIALGSANLITSFASGFAITGSFSRSAVNFQANAASALSGLLAGLIVLLAAEFITDIFVYIPAATLAAVISVATASMFNWEEIKARSVQIKKSSH